MDDNIVVANLEDRKNVLFQRALSRLRQCSGNNNFKAEHVKICGLNFASFFGADLVELLLIEGADIEVKTKPSAGATPLIFASGIDDNIEVISLLLKHGADIEAKNKHGSTALHYASRNGCDNVIKVLLHPQIEGVVGANINSVNNYGNTPLHHALKKHRNIDVVNLLLASGADMEIKNNNGKTFLDLGGHVEYIQSIMMKNSQRNIKHAKR
jgi:ankyrin repeat protein